MTVRAEELAAELKAARRGRGLYHPDIRTRLGPGLRGACGVGAADPPAEIRTKAITRLRLLTRALPEELSDAVQAALGIHPEVRDLLQLQERVDWLARRLRRDTRTARRRIDEACVRLAETAAAAGAAAALGLRPGGWYVESFHAVVTLDTDTPMTVERRVVVAERDGLDHLVLGWSVPRADGGGPQDVLVQVLYGGVLVAKERDTGTRFRLVLELPVTLRAGESHEYGLLVRIPPDQPMRNHYAYIPATRCDFFDLRVRFDRRRLPDRVWRVSEAFHRDLDERRPSGEFLAPDRAGELHVQFHEILPGHGYGIQWE